MKFRVPSSALLPRAGLSPAGRPDSIPGAVGFGATAAGGTGGTVYTVTRSVNPPTANSMMYTQLASPVSVSSYLTIDGQTAPGGATDITIQDSIIADPIGQQSGTPAGTSPTT
jgi:hypothetical protein